MNNAQIENVYATLWGVMEKGYEVEGVEDLFAEGKNAICYIPKSWMHTHG